LEAYDLSSRVAVVTGAASGIGEAAAEFLAASGATVVCADIDDVGTKATVGRIVAGGGRAVAHHTDVTRHDEVDGLVERAVRDFDRLDVMCNVAGAMFPGVWEDLTDGEIERGLDLNLRSVIWGCQAAVAAMKPRGTGSIINVSSGIIDGPYPGMGLYGITKAAVAMLSMGLAREVGQYGIRVNAIAPGATITNFTNWRLHKPDGTLDQEAYDTFVAQMRASSPLGTTGEAQDQAHLILYLASDASRWVTGNIHRVNGGQATPW
jgi:3-oxoacyl-[acyl-carrier protein] reductase